MSEWISVKTKLPDSDGHYLGWCVHGNPAEVAVVRYNWVNDQFAKEACPEEGGYPCWYDYLSSDTEVTHWQNLPAPPEGGEGGAEQVTIEHPVEELEQVINPDKITHTFISRAELARLRAIEKWAGEAKGQLEEYEVMTISEWTMPSSPDPAKETRELIEAFEKLGAGKS